MQTDPAIVTISSFASGRDVAVGLIAPAARQVRVLWVGESRLEHREISSLHWSRVEFEITAGCVPRQLSLGSAIVQALFDEDRRGCTSTEFVSRFPLAGQENFGLLDSLDDLLCEVALDMRLPPAGVDPSDDGISTPAI